jgi:DnaJ-class molecular chaperone
VLCRRDRRRLSVGRLIERERDTFLGAVGDADLLQTEVSVSVGEAARGTVLPVEVPLRGTCTRCGGRGETWPEPCESCYGTGASPLHHRMLFPVPPGVAHGACFRFRVNAPHAAPVRVEIRVAVRSAA